MKYTYTYPRPAVTVDAAVFRPGENNGVELLLIQRGKDPFEGDWALPGGFIEMDETVEEAVARELKEETSLANLELKQLHTFSAVNRDPRGRTISVVFWGILKDHQNAVAGDDAKVVKWFNIHSLPVLAFDHDEVVIKAILQLQENTQIRK